jgi:hypothetical protein
MRETVTLSLVKKLNPNVLMTQPAEDRYRNDLAAGLGASKVRRVLRQ